MKNALGSTVSRPTPHDASGYAVGGWGMQDMQSLGLTMKTIRIQK